MNYEKLEFYHEVIKELKAISDGLMKRLAACTWSRDDLKYYCGVAFGTQASKDLTIEQLEQFVKTVESTDYKTAINQLETRTVVETREQIRAGRIDRG